MLRCGMSNIPKQYKDNDAIAWCDGACEPNNPGGTGGWGFVIKAKGEIIASSYGVMDARPDMTNNVAEYAAVGAAVKAYQAMGRPGPLLVKTDSKLVVEQMKGNWRARKGAYIRVRIKLLELLETCEFEVNWSWVGRNENQEADALSVKGLEELGIKRGRR